MNKQACDQRSSSARHSPASFRISWPSWCRARRLTDLPFHPQVTSLDRPTFAMCDQVTSISRERLVRRHPGRLQPEDVDAMRFVLSQLIDTR